jgi:uncharacterized protein
MPKGKPITTAAIVAAGKALRTDTIDAPSTVYRHDGPLTDVYAGLSDAGVTGIGNSATGLGTRRDKGSHVSIPRAIHLLDVYQRGALFRSSRICRRAVESFPIAAGGNGWLWTFGGAAKDTQIKKLDAYCKKLKLKQRLVSASIEARKHGDGYLLIGAADGLDIDKPIGNVKTIEWIEFIGHHECQPGPGYLHQEDPDYYYLSGGAAKNKAVGMVHKSRIIRFVGDRLEGFEYQQNGGQNDSVLQTMLGALIQFRTGIDSTAGMLADYSVFLYKLDGLADLVMAGETDKLLSRFISMNMGMSVTQGLMMDAENEDASFVQRNYTGVKDMVDVLIEQLVAAADMPRSKLLGSAANTGLGAANRGDSDREDWELARKDWQVNNWEEPLLRIGNLILGAADFGARGTRKDFGVMFPSGLSLSAKDQAEVRKINAERFKIEKEAGILHEEEIRQALYGSAEYTAEVTLMYEELAKQRAIEAEDAFSLQQKRMEAMGGPDTVGGPRVPFGEGDNGVKAGGNGNSGDGEKAEGKEQKTDAIALMEYATISDEDLTKAREAWEANPPDVDFRGILGAGDK